MMHVLVLTILVGNIIAADGQAYRKWKDLEEQVASINTSPDPTHVAAAAAAATVWKSEHTELLSVAGRL